MIQAARIINIAILLVLIVGTTASAATDIRLRERVAMSGSVVRLGDVAEVVNADRQQARQLATLPLLPAPAPGTQRFLRKREIEDLLAAHGVDLTELRIDGAAQVTIDAGSAGEQGSEYASLREPRLLNRHEAILAGQDGVRRAAAIDQKRVEEIRTELGCIVNDYLKSKTGQMAAPTVTCDVVDRHLALLDAATSPATCQGGSPPWTGRQRFVVSFTTADGKMEIPVYAEVAAASVPMVVASKPIGRGEQITADHVEVRSMEYAANTSGRCGVDSIDKLIGMEARQAIREGDIVFADQVQAPLLVKRGDLVTVSSQGSGIRVRTTARAWKDGAQGEVVQVESLDTRERDDVRVVGPREAAVLAITRPAASEPADRIDTARR